MHYNLKLKNNIVIKKVQEVKFNEVLVNMKISMPLKATQNTLISLLVRMMADRTLAHPTKQAVQENLDFMYGAKVSASTYTLGNQQVMDVYVKTIHPRFVQEDLLKMQLDLLKEMVYHPLLTQQTLDEAKVNLAHYHARIKELPSHYAMQQAFKLAAPDSFLEIDSMGELSAIDAITLGDILAVHEAVVNAFSKTVIVVGDCAEYDDFSMFEEGYAAPLAYPLYDARVDARSIEQKHAGSQTEVLFVYATDINPAHPLYSAYLVFVALLGQLPSSYLFQNVREKHSLCYSIYASRQIYDGLMYISTGVNDDNLAKAKALIVEQFDLMRGDVLDIESAINYLVMALEGTFEKLKPIADVTYRNYVLDQDEDIETLQTRLKAVTQADVKAVMDHLSEPFIYAYRGEDNGKN